MADQVSRRDFLKVATAAGIAAACPQVGQAGPAAAEGFRFVHLTDVHIQPELAAAEGFAACIRAVEARRPRPEFLLTGGDLVFDALKVGPQRARSLFELFKKVLADNTSLPVHHTIGNHDAFGWLQGDGVTLASPGYGKAMVKDLLGLKETFGQFDHKGWRFLVLDNIQHSDDGKQPYRGALDGAQTDWLKQQLARTNPGTPIVICEHIPLLTVTPFAFESGHEKDRWVFGDSLICADWPTRLDMYAGHNVCLSLSGHIHQLDHIDYRGTTFVCGGAVCGDWWKGPRAGVKEGFGVIDLLPSGAVRYEYRDYGWKARS